MQEERDPKGPDDEALTAELQGWLRERLAGEEGRKEWRRLIEAAWNHLRCATLDTIVQEQQAATLIESYLEPARIRDLILPGIRAVVPSVVARMRRDTEPLSRWVPQETQDEIKRMASAPGLVHDDWIRAVFKQEAVEAVMADALYRGLRDFSTILPRIILSLLPTSRLPGFGGAGAMGKRLLDEFEKRLEPEIKSFLTGGTQRALTRAAEFAIQKKDSPQSVKARTELIDFVLSHSASFHVQAITDERIASAEPIAEAIAERIAAREESKTVLREELDYFFRVNGGRPVGEILETIGIRSTPDFDAWAAATWPAVLTYLRVPETGAWLDGLVVELLKKREELIEERNQRQGAEG